MVFDWLIDLLICLVVQSVDHVGRAIRWSIVCCWYAVRFVDHFVDRVGRAIGWYVVNAYVMSAI